MSKEKNKITFGKVVVAGLLMVLLMNIPLIGPFVTWIIGIAFNLFLGGHAVQYLVKKIGGEVFGHVVPDVLCYVIGFFFSWIAIPLAVLAFLFLDERTLKEVLN